MQRLLERLPILHSRDVSRAEAFLAERHIALELNGSARERASFDVHFNGVYLPGLWLGYIGYVSGVTTRILPDRGDYWVHIVTHGTLESAASRQWIEADERRALVVSPCERNVIKSAPGTGRLSLCIKGEALTAQLAALIDKTPRSE